ncbi:MAG: beta-lactamase family protein [Saprospiraceae bacterium]|nr:beta-lactamase family protein [Saprospiraceae bacterium]
MRNIYWIAAFFGLLLASCTLFHKGSESKPAPATPNYADSLDLLLRGWLDQGNLPGFAVAVFSKDTIYYQRGFGYANLETRQAYTPNTVQMIASVSKTLIGVALMQAVEAGKLNLDDDINKYLPFRVIHPKYPDSVIRIRHLAMHVSGIRDSLYYNRSYLFGAALDKNIFSKEWWPLVEVYNRNQPIEMSVFLEKILSKQGEWYNDDNFYDHAPGAAYEYSNLGATLLAYILERATKEDYRSFTRKRILQPLGMRSSSWEKPQKCRKCSAYYLENGSRVPEYRLITYPDGGLYSSVADMTKFLQEMIKGFGGEGTLLPTRSYHMMMGKQPGGEAFPDGLCWDLSIPCCIGHAGNDFGTSTLMYFEPSTGVGRILFANKSLQADSEATFYGIFNDLFRYDLRK